MLIEVYRNGTLVDQIRAGAGTSAPTAPTFTSLVARRLINGVDEVNPTVPTGRCVAKNDRLKVYDGDAYLGEFTVKRVEPTLGEDNTELTKITAPAAVGLALICTAIPSEFTLVATTIGNAMTLLVALVFSQIGVIITITDVAGEAAISAEGIKTNASNGVEALRDILGAAGLRWRCRPDLGNVIEYGDFGTIQPVTLREANNAKNYVELAAHGVYVAISSQPIISDFDTADILVPEGGTFSLSDGTQVPLTLRLASVVPAGFSIDPVVFGAETYYTIQRIGNTERCHKPFIAGNILPEGSPPSPSQEEAAANTLAAAAAEYLDSYSTTLYNFNASTPFSLTGKVAVGDKINYASRGLNCGGEFKGLLFVASFTTTWGDDNSVVSVVELSTRLESLVDPQSLEFGAGAKQRRLTDTRTSFTVGGLANPNIVIPFGTTYSSPPAVTLLPGVGCNATLIAITSSSITLSSTISPLPCTVAAIIYPP